MIRVLIIAEDSSLRDRLRELLAADGDVAVVDGVMSSDVEADVILWMLEESRLDIGQALGVAATEIPILMIGERSVMTEALDAGVRGYLTGIADPVRVLAAVRAVAAGLQVIDPAVAGDVPEGDAGSAGSPVEDHPVLPEELTDREQQVLQLLAEGLSNREIARRLRISEHTAKFHVNAILGKLGAHTRTEAVTRAARRGLISF